MKSLNTANDRYKLAEVIVQSARYVENHTRFMKEHNFEMFYAFIDAATKAAVVK